ncbi:hypothetical protein BH10PSE6_BH10PSE6_00980 [soil metagenome]
MATFTGTDADETITPTMVSPTVTRNPAGSFPGGGSDTLYGGGGDDVLDGGGTEGFDTLNGGTGDDTLIAGAGDGDRLDGGAGADSMSGGAGDDLYYVDDVGDDVIEASGAGTDEVQSSISYVLSYNLENLTLIGLASVDGRGNSANNRLGGTAGDNLLVGRGGHDLLEGFDGNDTLNGGDGNDSLSGDTGADNMNGGAGNDIYYVDNVGDVVTDSGGVDEVNSQISYILGAGLENLSITGSSPTARTATGNDLNNVIRGGHHLFGMGGDDVLFGGSDLYGGDGADTLYGGSRLDGGAGADIMDGRQGNDLYFVDDAGDIAGEEADWATGGGVDTVRSSISHTLSENLENLELLGILAIDGTGNAKSNTIVGNGADNALSGLAGDDTLDGGAGADDMDGGLGADLYIVDNAGDVAAESDGDGAIDTVEASVSHTLSANLENLTLTSSAPIDGTGNGRANVIQGNGAANVLAGLGGVDTLNGGGGIDTLIGGGDNDTLDGGSAADSMAGGLGDDLYLVDDAGDAIIENPSSGTDMVQSSVSFILSANVENLTLTGAGDLDGTGNGQDNVVVGTVGANVLEGADGNDSLQGGNGDDVLDGGTGADTMVGGDGQDLYVVDSLGDIVDDGTGFDSVQSSISYTLGYRIENLTLTGAANIDGKGHARDNVIIGNSGDNVLRGKAGNDRLNGKEGNDTLDGGVGSDNMGGGLGADLYIVDNVGDIAEESNGDGAVDTVQASVSHTLSQNLENLTLTGEAEIDGTGNARANVIQGNGAANVLAGKGGADTLAGGGGGDTFQFDTPLVAGVVTTITDMTHEVDKVALKQTVFTQAGPIGGLASEAFHVGAAAHDASDRIIYNSATGDLQYDLDGSGGQAGTVFANVGPGLVLNAGDFGVV